LRSYVKIFEFESENNTLCDYKKPATLPAPLTTFLICFNDGNETHQMAHIDV